MSFVSRLLGLFVIVGLGALSACSSPQIEDYADKTPTFDIREFLNGDVDANGMFVARDGKVDPFFNVALRGTWSGDEGTLDEHFIYSDGRTQDRTWTLKFVDDHHFIGTAPDVMGEAHGAQFGNAVRMQYVLAVKTTGGSTYNMSMDDWLYMLNDETVLNRNVMSKFGYHAGELIITFHKKKPTALDGQTR